jgi:cytochrome c oxidase cbb3-type subunit 3
MLAWEPVLGAERVRSVAAYVNSLKGKNLPGKAPEGEKLKN